MTPASSPAPDGPLPRASELANGARDFRLRMAVIGLVHFLRQRLLTTSDVVVRPRTRRIVMSFEGTC